MSKMLGMVYALFAYALFLATFTYAIGFVGSIGVPRGINDGPPVPLAEALVVNLLLLGLFAMQHTVMARRSFKRWWARVIPEPIERATFVLAATLVLALLLWQWRPMAEPVVWSVQHRGAVLALNAVFWLGGAVLLTSTFLLDHFELFGLRQPYAAMRGRAMPAPEFRTPLLYRHVRHPLYLGFVLSFWATPLMTAGHLLFAIATTGYILLGIWFEERDLISQFGDRYRVYREQVGMLLPRIGGTRGDGRAQVFAMEKRAPQQDR